MFYRTTNGRKSKNSIGSLENERGVKVKGEREVEEEILSFFTKLYDPIMSPKPFVEDIDWCPVSDLEDAELVAPFSLNEIRNVVFGCDGIKSPGLTVFHGLLRGKLGYCQ